MNDQLTIQSYSLEQERAETGTITDVPGVRVGHVTLSEGSVQTGITVVVPYAEGAENALYFYGKHFEGKNAELTGFQVIDDFGLLSAPVFMTSLLSVGKVYNGAITYAFTRGSGLPTSGGWPPIVLGYDDRGLNDGTQRRLTEAHALQALDNATTGTVAQGSVGAGRGALAFGFKGGIGSAAGQLSIDEKRYTVGVLVTASFGTDPRESTQSDGILAYPSLLAVLATDAPLSSEILNRLAEAASVGGTRLADKGQTITSSVVAFSTGNVVRDPDEDGLYRLEFVSDTDVSSLEALAQTVSREAVIQAIAHAEPVSGYEGRQAETIPDSALDLLRERR